MSKWRCAKCNTVAEGTPNEFNGMFYCEKDDPRNNWVVAYFDTHDYSALIGPREVHVRKGETVKDTQDRIAEAIENDPRDHIIYFVVRESDFRNYYRQILDYWFKR